MKSFAVATILASAATVSAQVTFDQNTNTFSCPIPNGAYCAGSSLSSNIIIRCSNGTGHAGNCNDNLAGVPPVGVKSFAPCYQTSDNAGDAACSFNGVVYPDSGASFSINGTSTTAATTAGPVTVPTAGATTLYSTSCNTTSGAAGPTGGNAGNGGNGGNAGNGGHAAATGSSTWAPSGSPSPTMFHGAAGKVMGSAYMALLPVAGFIAYMF